MPVTPPIVQSIRNQFRLDWWGPHGVAHWARVYENGVTLAKETGADLEVVELFALFHDARRQNDAADPQHGQRGAEFALSMRNKLGITDAQLALLVAACREHSAGQMSDDPTIQTCWDADRLDLARVGITPRAEYLSPHARGLIEWASQRARRGFIPDVVRGEWATHNPGGAARGDGHAERAYAAMEAAYAEQQWHFLEATKSYAAGIAATLADAERARTLAREGEINEARRVRAFWADGGLAALEALAEAIDLPRLRGIIDELAATPLAYLDDRRIARPTLALRVCGPQMEALVDRSFVWPTSGVVTCTKYNGVPVDDDHGLYGLAWGADRTEPATSHLYFRDQELPGCAPSAKWLVLRVDEGVKLPEGGISTGDHGRWIKFGRAEVLHVGNGIGAESFENAIGWIVGNAARLVEEAVS